jgi:hypothetical protein
MQAKTLSRVFVDEGEDLDLPAVLGPVEQEVVGPNVVGSLGSVPNAALIAIAQTTAFLSPSRYSQAFTAPQALHALAVDPPSLPLEKSVNPTIAVARMFPRQPVDVREQSRLVARHEPLSALGRSMLPDQETGAALRDLESLLKVIHRALPADRA